MLIYYQVIPHESQRYDTVGDYFFAGDTLHLRVSKLSDARYEWLVALHELIELATCQLMGVEFSAIDAFDLEYEKAREEHRPLACGCEIQDEPGHDPHAPYHKQHTIADLAERAIAFLLGVSWASYDAEVEAL